MKCRCRTGSARCVMPPRHPAAARGPMVAAAIPQDPDGAVRASLPLSPRALSRPCAAALADSLTRVLPVLLCLVLVLVPGEPSAAPGDNEVMRVMRASRRAAMRQATAVADSVPVLFGLAVIPVDFADARLPEGWEPGAWLGEHIFPLQGETLANYFRVASRDRLELRILLAPLVHLAEERRAYSDLDLQGFSRSRKLARQSLEALKGSGFDFRLLDMDGPDGLPGSGDDDGQVDGVLILHAGPGEENDPAAGLIQALSYFLDEPVVDRGVEAGLYSVASLHSGLGIWAHEVAHLFGLEDRYDTNLAVTQGDPRSRGGLGIFSLMAAGAWGTGAGRGAALMDAYSASQLGWCDVVSVRGDGQRVDTLRTVLSGGQAWRVWSHGRNGAEYFLLETRGAPTAAPFDADLPENQLLIYHVDADLPEGAVADGGPGGTHIRVALVEADGDGLLTVGEDFGRPEDLFPGPLQVLTFTPESMPASDGYTGPTEVALTEITSLSAGVSLRLQDADAPGLALAFSFAGGQPAILDLQVTETGTPLDSVQATVQVVSSPAWGSFAGGQSKVVLELARGAPGVWAAVDPPRWYGEPGLPPGAATRFQIELASGAWQAAPGERYWVWQETVDPLDFSAAWPDDWSREHPGGDTLTTWHRWSGEPALTADGSPILICTGREYTGPGDWPEVSYHNNADAVLVSGHLPAGTQAVRLLHALDGEMMRPGVAWDAGVVEVALPDNDWVEVIPVDEYDGSVEPSARSPLHGRGAFVGNDSLTTTGPLVWRIDVVPVPESSGPLRLRLRFSSDAIFRGRGWLVARMEAVALPEKGMAFPVDWVESSGASDRWLAWDYPGQDASEFAIQLSVDQGANWSAIWAGMPGSGIGDYRWAVPASSLALPDGVSRRARTLVRVVADVPVGRIAARPRSFYADGGAAPAILLGSPYPNPAATNVHLLLGLPRGGRGILSLFDLRGRRVRQWSLAGGQQLLVWDGQDEGGQRVAPGIYIFRLATAGQGSSRKVVLLP